MTQIGIKDVYPGQPLRFPVEKKDRFVPLSGKAWLKTYTFKTSPKEIDVHDGILNP